MSVRVVRGWRERRAFSRYHVDLEAPDDATDCLRAAHAIALGECVDDAAISDVEMHRENFLSHVEIPSLGYADGEPPLPGADASAAPRRSSSPVPIEHEVAL